MYTMFELPDCWMTSPPSEEDGVKCVGQVRSKPAQPEQCLTCAAYSVLQPKEQRRVIHGVKSCRLIKQHEQSSFCIGLLKKLVQAVVMHVTVQLICHCTFHAFGYNDGLGPGQKFFGCSGFRLLLFRRGVMICNALRSELSVCRAQRLQKVENRTTRLLSR